MVNSYVVLARKWRPSQFTDIVGQGHIVRTLMNAIRTERIHQAYLFTGSRGIGKTSIARIFAKAVRCETRTDKDDSLYSCDACPNCKEITSTNSVDVIEIDGASNNGVDAIREIREGAKYLPSSGNRKIYIIDEVHMLTTAAFNALLKTLEEPPAHVVFIFATTEPHKIPATVLSRCQRFDFRRVTMAQIQQRLIEVTAAEEVQADPAALSLIGRAAEGSMRDALSLLDQVIAFSGSQITVESVRNSVGLIESQMIIHTLKNILARNPVDALKEVENAYQQGHDLRILTKSLIEYLHCVILAKVGAAAPSTLELSQDEWKEIQTLSELRELEELELIFQALHHGMEWISKSEQPKVVLDVLIVKCATAEALFTIGEAGTSGPKTAATPKGLSQAKVPAANTLRADQNNSSSNDTPTTQETPSAAPTADEKPVSAAQGIIEKLKQKENAPAPRTAANQSINPVKKLNTAPVSMRITSSEQPKAAAAPKTPRTWEGLVYSIKRIRPHLASLLEHVTTHEYTAAQQVETGVKPGMLAMILAPGDETKCDQLKTQAYTEQLRKFAEDYYGHRIVVEFMIRNDQKESIASKKAKAQVLSENATLKEINDNPVLKEARALFGSALGPIEILDQKGEVTNVIRQNNSDS